METKMKEKVLETKMRTEKFMKDGEEWIREIDTGIMYREEDVIHETIDGKEHTLTFGLMDQKGLLKMFTDVHGQEIIDFVFEKYGEQC
jgi:hypothetical protein